MTINIDVPGVEDEDHAYGLMMHHLSLAAAYFEATATNVAALIPRDDVYSERVRVAAKVFVDRLEAEYEEETEN
jgi:hypothetical protein